MREGYKIATLSALYFQILTLHSYAHSKFGVYADYISKISKIEYAHPTPYLR